MRYFLFFIFTTISLFADLQSKIHSNAQTACFLKNPTNGLSSSDYNPTVTGQTLRQSIESSHTSTQSSATCDSWTLNPYVNVDTETYQVIANMDCTVNSEQVTAGSGEYQSTTTYYWTVINQYALNIDCQASCEIPKDSNGVNYEQVGYISEADCTVANLQILLDTNNPSSGFIIDDAQYLNCSTNAYLTGCYYKKHVNFDGNTDNNSTDNNSTDNNTTDNNSTISNADLTGTNQRLDSLGVKIDANGQKIDALGIKFDDIGTKIDSNGQKIDNLGTKIDANGIKIDAVRDSVMGTGNYLGAKLDAMGNSITDELKFQGDRLHDDLNDLKSLQSEPNDGNGSNGFDDTGIIEAIEKNTESIKEIKDMNEGEVETDASFLDTYQAYYDDMSQSIQSVENNVNDLMATINGDFTPQFQNHNSCIIYFSIMGKSKSVDMCRYAYMLRPFFTFILTIAMLILLIRLHFYLFPKVYKSD